MADDTIHDGTFSLLNTSGTRPRAAEALAIIDPVANTSSLIRLQMSEPRFGGH
jgi:hypothetical protein